MTLNILALSTSCLVDELTRVKVTLDKKVFWLNISLLKKKHVYASEKSITEDERARTVDDGLSESETLVRVSVETRRNDEGRGKVRRLCLLEKKSCSRIMTDRSCH